MSDLAKRLEDLWDEDKIKVTDREKGIKLLTKIFTSIINNPNDPKFRDLNFQKVRQKLIKCTPAFYLLYTAGFTQNVDGSRLIWQNNKINQKLLNDAYAGLNLKIKNPHGKVEDTSEYGSIEVMKDRDQMVKRKKKEKAKEEKELQKNLKQIEKMEQDQNNDNNNNDTNNDNDDVDVDQDEMDKAMKMSMEQDNDDDNNNNDDTENADTTNKDKDKEAEANGDQDKDKEQGDVEMNDKSEDVAQQLQEAGLSAEDLDLIEQIKAAKGITVTLNASDLKGLSKEEKIAKFQDVRDKYRKEKQQNIVKAKLDKEKRRRENIKKAQEAERKRKEYEMRMVASRKKREKQEAERRKKAIKEKIAADKKRRLEQKEREKRKKEAAKAAKLKAQQQQADNQ